MLNVKISFFKCKILLCFLDGVVLEISEGTQIPVTNTGFAVGYTAQKVSELQVFLVHIFQHSD